MKDRTLVALVVMATAFAAICWMLIFGAVVSVISRIEEHGLKYAVERAWCGRDGCDTEAQGDE